MNLGYVCTPAPLVLHMTPDADIQRHAESGSRILEPGCGICSFLERFAAAYAAHAKANGFGKEWIVDRIRGVEIESSRANEARNRIAAALRKHGFRPSKADLQAIVVEEDFLQFKESGWDVIVGNPPYVRLEDIGEAHRRAHRRRFQAATNRYDMYFLFFEHALSLLAPDGALRFVTPQKYMQVWSASALRGLMLRHSLARIELLPENTFGGYVTYPAITSLIKRRPTSRHMVEIRDERTSAIHNISQGRLTTDPWAAVFGARRRENGATLRDIAASVGVGVATGADSEFLVKGAEQDFIPQEWVRRTISGRQLPVLIGDAPERHDLMVWPYDAKGRLVEESQLPAHLRDFLALRRAKLKARTCHSLGRRQWYEFHETPRVSDYERPKILTADIQADPTFHLDVTGLVPRHSVYYIVPKAGVKMHELLAYLNSEPARNWLKANCQAAAGGRIRVQSKMLRRLPIPARLLAGGSAS